MRGVGVAAVLLQLAALVTALLGGDLGPRPSNVSTRSLKIKPRLLGGDELLEDETSHLLWLRYTHPRVMDPAFDSDAHLEEAVVTGTLQQPLDHLDPDSTATWTQIYRRTKASYVAGGPAFVMLSGTDDYSSDWLRQGQMADLARRFGADRFFLPFRFYARDHHPTADSSVASLAFLSTEQILHDVASFLSGLLQAGELQAEQRVILFGAGYGAAIASWARQRFPDLVHGVVASSATLEARYSAHTYFPVVSDAVNWYHRKDMNCEPLIRAAFQALETSLSSKDGRREFNEAIKPCTPIPEEQRVSDEDRAHILGLVAGMFADLVQEDEDGPNADNRPGGDKLDPYCYILSQFQNVYSPLTTLGSLLQDTYPGRCVETSQRALVAALANTSWASQASVRGLRQWYWQQCTELGQFPVTTDSTYTFPYSSRLTTASFYKKLCTDVFGDGITNDLVKNIENVNTIYGGRKPTGSHIIFVKGDLDPWKDLSPADGYTGQEVHVFSVRRASHAHDMFPRNDFDPPWMKTVRKAVASILANWLKTSEKPSGINIVNYHR